MHRLPPNPQNQIDEETPPKKKCIPYIYIYVTYIYIYLYINILSVQETFFRGQTRSPIISLALEKVDPHPKAWPAGHQKRHKL